MQAIILICSELASSAISLTSVAISLVYSWKSNWLGTGNGFATYIRGVSISSSNLVGINHHRALWKIDITRRDWRNKNPTNKPSSIWKTCSYGWNVNWDRQSAWVLTTSSSRMRLTSASAATRVSLSIAIRRDEVSDEAMKEKASLVALKSQNEHTFDYQTTDFQPPRVNKALRVKNDLPGL